ncbi:antibiotic biosynthesis monooxygenase [Leptotrichia wadei]|uniref:Antibiotic biosynthesis monooxygenase n=1 Tax=Leptotrichia wadei TaxID=157687 RepID=A0A7U6QYI3_9FUSO|nr:hypothetical protein [Leptotrichia wadei]BBM42893.1 antibiotic biosynthesis monooxygenase [Leptotrichia wadei]
MELRILKYFLMVAKEENIIENKEFINIEGVKLLNKGNLNYVK